MSNHFHFTDYETKRTVAIIAENLASHRIRRPRTIRLAGFGPIVQRRECLQATEAKTAELGLCLGLLLAAICEDLVLPFDSQQVGPWAATEAAVAGVVPRHVTRTVASRGGTSV